MTITTTELPVDLSVDNEGLGTLVITDVRALVRPARHDQSFQVGRDTAHAATILDLANDQTGTYGWHIFSPYSAQGTRNLLSRVFSAYVTECSANAEASYVVYGKQILASQCGVHDGKYTMHFTVYCNVWYAMIDPLLESIVSANEGTCIVVRPDPSEHGYAAQAFVTEHTVEEDFDEMNHDCPRCGSHDCNTWNCQQ